MPFPLRLFPILTFAVAVVCTAACASTAPPILATPANVSPYSIDPPKPYPTPSFPSDIKALTAIASSGDAAAQCELGIDYDTGHGVFKNFVQAREWFTRSAAAHNGCGITNFGNLYFDGDGVAVDYTTARAFFEAGALAGYGAAFYNLGKIYADGDGVQVDEHLAAAWLSKAAIAKIVLAYSELGDLYAFGHQTRWHNVGLAVHYYRMAIQSRYPESFCCADERRTWAASNLAFLYRDVYRGDDRLRYGMVFQLLRRSPNDAWTQYELAQMYLYGFGVKKDYPVGGRWLKKSADQGYPRAEALYAAFLLEGVFGPVHPTEGLRYLHAAVLDGDENAMFELGALKFEGKFMPRDNRGAVALFTEASSRGSQFALNQLASMYLHGVGVHRSLYQAYILFSVQVAIGAKWGPGLKRRLERGLSAKQLESAQFEIKSLSQSALTAQNEQSELPPVPPSSSILS
jgi:TPR repeat protein